MLRIPEEHLLSKVSKIQWRAPVARHTACVLCYQSRLLLLPRQGIHDEPCCRRHKAWTILAVQSGRYCVLPKDRFDRSLSDSNLLPVGDKECATRGGRGGSLPCAQARGHPRPPTATPAHHVSDVPRRILTLVLPFQFPACSYHRSQQV